MRPRENDFCSHYFTEIVSTKVSNDLNAELNEHLSIVFIIM